MTPRIILAAALTAGVSWPALAAGPVPPVPVAPAAIQLAQAPTFTLRDIQLLLNRRGFDAGTPDGIMGERTRGAIRSYQSQNGLEVTGEATTALYNHLRGEGTDAAAPAAAPSQLVVDTQTALRRRGYDIPSISGTVDPPTVAAIRRFQAEAGLVVTGDVSPALLARLQQQGGTPPAAPTFSIRDIQQALNQRGYNVGAPDGALGPRTRAAIRTYQADAGLPVTGEPSAELFAHLTGQAGTGTPGGPNTASPPPAAEMVVAVQSELRQRGYEVPAVNGTLDNATRAAIRRFQADAGMRVDGEVNDELLQRLRQSGGQAASGPVDRRVVAMIQQELNQRGYDAGAPDGSVGPRTRTAIRTYQTDAGLQVTGEPSRELLRTIREREQRAGQSRHRGPRPDRPDRPGPSGAATPGAETALIADIERELSRHGYPVGPVDGTLDMQSRTAILNYQADAHLPETGEPSPALLAHIRTSEVRAGQPATPEGAARDAVQGLTRGLIDRMGRPGTNQ